MKQLNNAVNIAPVFVPYKRYLNLYLDSSPTGDIRYSLEDAVRLRHAHAPSGGIIMCIERTVDGDFRTTKVGEF